MEQNYKGTLVHIVKWLGGENEWDMGRPISAEYAFKIRQVCIDVLEGMDLKDAIIKAETP